MKILADKVALVTGAGSGSDWLLHWLMVKKEQRSLSRISMSKRAKKQ
ncbi:Uncharacterised protein [Sphingobacterium multivorum]|uniref:Uncharacterized protein n=1 Tax=Sphingobacterium multivorum TaxID=28454 RepID=A0A2X2L859_SPHMU|nr:Uncharacterised protein [Sphingobacterium multivorum]